MKKPYILITNDDGIHADGIKHLYNAIKPYAECEVVAPFVEKSGAGLSTTLIKTLQIHEINWHGELKAYRINGTPADCVKLATSVLIDKKPDIIVSGINRGSNAGRNVLYSGTIGAVIEGIYKGIPGIAFSCFDLKEPDYDAVEKYIYPIVDHVLNNPLEEGCFLNVNFPEDKHQPFKGLKMAIQGKAYCKENPDKRIHPSGHIYYWMGGQWHAPDNEDEKSDTYLLEQGYITATPLDVRQLACLEHYEKYKPLEKLFQN